MSSPRQPHRLTSVYWTTAQQGRVQSSRSLNVRTALTLREASSCLPRWSPLPVTAPAGLTLVPWSGPHQRARCRAAASCWELQVPGVRPSAWGLGCTCHRHARVSTLLERGAAPALGQPHPCCTAPQVFEECPGSRGFSSARKGPYSFEHPTQDGVSGSFLILAAPLDVSQKDSHGIVSYLQLST